MFLERHKIVKFRNCSDYDYMRLKTGIKMLKIIGLNPFKYIQLENTHT